MGNHVAFEHVANLDFSKRTANLFMLEPAMNHEVSPWLWSIWILPFSLSSAQKVTCTQMLLNTNEKKKHAHNLQQSYMHSSCNRSINFQQSTGTCINTAAQYTYQHSPHWNQWNSILIIGYGSALFTTLPATSTGTSSFK